MSPGRMDTQDKAFRRLQKPFDLAGNLYEGLRVGVAVQQRHGNTPRDGAAHDAGIAIARRRKKLNHGTQHVERLDITRVDEMSRAR